jgi:hypothetical protein
MKEKLMNIFRKSFDNINDFDKNYIGETRYVRNEPVESMFDPGYYNYNNIYDNNVTYNKSEYYTPNKLLSVTGEFRKKLKFPRPLANYSTISPESFYIHIKDDIFEDVIIKMHKILILDQNEVIVTQEEVKNKLFKKPITTTTYVETIGYNLSIKNSTNNLYDTIGLSEDEYIELRDYARKSIENRTVKNIDNLVDKLVASESN